MKEFQITAEAFPSRTLVFGAVCAFNLRDAWYFFKKRNKQYKRLRFHSARTLERSYFKVY